MSIGKRAGVTIIDPLEYLCTEGICPGIMTDGTPIYKDGGHIRPFSPRNYCDFIDSTVGIEGRPSSRWNHRPKSGEFHFSVRRNSQFEGDHNICRSYKNLVFGFPNLSLLLWKLTILLFGLYPIRINFSSLDIPHKFRNRHNTREGSRENQNLPPDYKQEIVHVTLRAPGPFPA